MGDIHGLNLNGQWVGRFEGTNPGLLIINIDDLGSIYQGTAFIFNDDLELPVTVAEFSVPEKSHAFAIRTKYLLALDPKSLQAVPPNEVLQRFGSFSKYADIQGALDSDKLDLNWKTDIDQEGRCTIHRSKAAEPSEVRAEEMDWNDYKKFVAGLEPGRPIFRGQNSTRRLRTSYHRLGRADMSRFVNGDIPILYRKLGARTRHIFDINKPDENGAFLNLLQHHGYPTPLLDWTHSPYVAAFFAYRGTSNRMADCADGSAKVRILIFDAEKWDRIFQSHMQLIFPKLHITIAEFMAIENDRLIPQQAVTMVTNIDDVETYIKQRETDTGETFLRAVDLPLPQRRNVVRELNYMGITAGSMFPGLDGACEDLKERNFDF